MPTVTISQRGEERSRTGHPWIYKSDVASVEAAKARIQPLVVERIDIAAAAEMPRAEFEKQLAGWVTECSREPTSNGLPLTTVHGKPDAGLSRCKK